MSLRVYSCSDPITEPDILESIRALPTEDDLLYDDGGPMETARERKSWVVWQEGMRFPDVITELLSDTTREVDKGEKKRCTRSSFARPSITSTIRLARNSLAIISTAGTMKRCSKTPSRKSFRQ
jgi:hypothetical protein